MSDFFFPFCFIYFSGLHNLQKHIKFPPVTVLSTRAEDTTKHLSNWKRRWKTQQTSLPIHLAKALCVPAQ